jgi:acetyl-CoA decarbonylase/synthase complex subunit gamma
MLTGLQIYKLLPKTNCKECGFATCLAFALQLAAQKVELELCPYLSEEAKAALGEATIPPIRLIKITSPAQEFLSGNETVLYRHEQTFYHAPGIAIKLKADLTPEEMTTKLAKIQALTLKRIGMTLGIDLLALEDVKAEPDKFAAAAQFLAAHAPQPLILISHNLAALQAALNQLPGYKPLLYAPANKDWAALGALAQEFKVPLVVNGEDLIELESRAKELKQTGLQDLVLSIKGSPQERLHNLVQLRHQALKLQNWALGYPALVEVDNEPAALLHSISYICKYASILIFDDLAAFEALPLHVLRQNIYSDPRKPIQVEAKLYALGGVTPQAPLLITTNFSLTYFTVEAEITASKIPCYLLVVDTEGTSVLTAWAADKFNAAKITQALKESKVEELLEHRRLLLPGYVAVLSGELEETSGWKVWVGPKEASGIPKYLKLKAQEWA